MRHRQHNVPTLLLFMLMVFMAVLSAGRTFSGDSLVAKAACVALMVAGAAVCLIEMADYFMFGNEEKER